MDIKDRIRKLLAVANDKGATEDEAATAMKFAMALMAKHGIEQSSLGDDAPKAREGSLHTEEMKKYELTLATAAGVLYGCYAVRYSSSGFSFVGRADNIEAAEFTHLWLINQVESLYKDHLPKGLSQSERSEFRRTFKEGCALRVCQRAREFVSNPSSIASETGSTALVVGDYFKRLNDENVRLLESKGVRIVKVKYRAGNGTDIGRRAGDSVQLHRQVR